MDKIYEFLKCVARVTAVFAGLSVASITNTVWSLFKNLSGEQFVLHRRR